MEVGADFLAEAEVVGDSRGVEVLLVENKTIYFVYVIIVYNDG